MTGFVHLHVHTEYSLVDSVVRVPELVAATAAAGMPAVAITDQGNLFGLVKFYRAALAAGVQPIAGAEVWLAGAAGKGPADRTEPGRLVLLCRTETGYLNLCRLLTRAWVEGQQGGLPFIEAGWLADGAAAGLIALSGGRDGVLGRTVLAGSRPQAERLAGELKALFGGDLYVELQRTGRAQDDDYVHAAVRFASDVGLPVVATNDVRFLTREDFEAHEARVCIQTGYVLGDGARPRHYSDQQYLRTPAEMAELFADLPEALENTVEIARRCHLTLRLGQAHLPDYAVPDGTTPDEYLRSQSVLGLAARFRDAPPGPEYAERLATELDVICRMGFSGYFLIVADFIRWARDQAIPVGPGRGSGAGSLVAWVLGITDLDPIRHDLLFERFLNPERVSMPDFDIDFCMEGRDRVIDYVSERYGRDRVSQIITYGTMAARAVVRDVGRVLGQPYGQVDRIAKLVPNDPGAEVTLESALAQEAELRDLYQRDEDVRSVIDLGRRLEGLVRNAGRHAGGLVIAPRDITAFTPLYQVEGEKFTVTQFDKDDVEAAGLVKFDFLGLVTLDLLDMACRFIHERADREGRPRPEIKGRDLNYENIPLDEPRAFDLCTRGDTMGVFQFESGGMQQLCKRVRPDKFAEISAITSLFRPGPLESGMVEDFINRKFGKAKVEYMFPEMEAPLKETYGTILYQEQVLEIARRVSGFSLGGADMLRRAMGKKIEKEMAAQRAAFVDGAVKNGKPAAKASELFDLIEKFAGYGFNKSHADAYSVLTLQTAYLKAVYPTEFFAALLAIEKGDTEKVAKYIQDARQRNLEVLPPDVNESGLDFTIIRDGVIRFGLSAIKNVGEGAAEAILVGRKEGPFKDFFDFLSRVDAKALNKRTVECLIQAGALDFAETDKTAYRSKLLGILEKAVEWSGKLHESRNEGQFSLFGGGGGEGPAQDMPPPRFDPNAVPLTQRQILDFEKQLLGVFVSGSPMDKYLDRARRAGALAIEQLVDRAPKSYVTVAGIVVEFREVRVKKGRMAGELMAILKIEDPSGQVEVVSFPAHYKEFAEIFKSGNPLLMKAELDFEEDRPKLICSVGKNGQEGSRIEDLTLIEDRAPKKLALTLALDRVDGLIPPHLICEEIAEVLRKHHGPIPVSMTLVKTGHFETKMDLGETYKVHAHEALYEELRGVVAIPGGLRVDAVY